MLLAGVFVDVELDGDFCVNDALALVFDVFDRSDVGAVPLVVMVDFVAFFWRSVLGDGREVERRTSAAHEQLLPVTDSDGYVSREAFVAHFRQRSFAYD